jgi:ABC-type transporter Mla MlaB component
LTEPDRPAPSPARAIPPALALAGRIGPDAVPALCDRVRESAGEPGDGPLSCDCGGVERPDVGTIEAIARMALTARRVGRRLELRRSRRELVELLGLVGLSELAVEVVGQPEEREEASRVQEEDDPADPVA